MPIPRTLNYKARRASSSELTLNFTSMTTLVAALASYPAWTIFHAVTSGGDHIMHILKAPSGNLQVIGWADWTKVYLFLDHADYQFASITGASNLTVDANGVTFDVATAGAIYLKGFKGCVEQRMLVCKAGFMAGNATPSTNDTAWAGWISDPSVAYTLNAGGIYYNGTNWRQGRHAGSDVTAPTVTQASNNMTLTPSAVALEDYTFKAIHAICEDGTEAMIMGANKLASGYFPQNDGSTTLGTAVAMAVTAGQEIWFLCFGARSVSVGTAQVRLKSSVVSMGAFA